MESKRGIAIIGAGNMGQALYEGLLRSSKLSRHEIRISRDKKHNRELVRSARFIIIAVEPPIVSLVLQELRSVLDKEQILISAAARVSLAEMERCLPKRQPLIRMMPNLAAEVGEAMTCWKAKNLGKRQKQEVQGLLRSFGKEHYLQDESLLQDITALSGSGPAYCFYLAELLEEFAKSLNCEKKLADKIVRQTIKGAAILLAQTPENPQTLRRKVTSKGGTTEKIFKALDRYGFGKIFLRALTQGKKQGAKILPR